MRELREGQVLSPAPPPDVRWISFTGATIPALTRDGRKWGGDLSSGLPDPYAKLFVNGGLLLQSTIQTGTLTPTWPDAPRGNFRLHKDDRFRLEIWDNRVINDRPIGVRELGGIIVTEVFSERIDVETGSGVRMILATEYARGRVGYGFFYELRTYDVYVSKLYAESPAARAGMRKGDQILMIDGVDVRDMNEGETRTALHSRRTDGVKLAIKHADGTRVDMTIVEGAIYPLYSEVGSFQ
ncbi:MAG: PDZ domain-containing protein [Polyangiaceae bacterium]|nr:PDZ domain-containing protein [Polyangiaceae bacterium]